MENFCNVWLYSFLFAAFAQVPQNAGEATKTAPPSSFEVISIKPSPPDGRPSMGRFPGGRFIANFTPARILIEAAYGLNSNQLSGSPQWIYDARFDVNAQPGRSAAPDEFKPMLQSLLAERFRLKVHWESKQSTVYGLVIAKSGEKLRRVEVDDPAKTGFPSSRLSQSSVRLMPVKTTMAAFAQRLEIILGSPVLDETHLAGNFSFTLDYAIPNAPLRKIRRRSEPLHFSQHYKSNSG